MEPEFSILVVCLNPGEKLKKTLDSIESQTYKNYEIIIKDGLSTDGSLDYVKDAKSSDEALPVLRLIEEKDKGIYDAMNQAVRESNGRYLYFLNCGDIFYSENVLAKVAQLIDGSPSEYGIYYGNIYERITEHEVASNPRIDDFGCYRNVPCHQACFYDRKLLLAHPFELKYRVRADYEQFLWCYFTKELPQKVSFVYNNLIIADYEGGGFSETKENKKVSSNEHKEIVKKYMPAQKVMKYKMLMWLTLAPLRTWIAENPATSGLYNKIKKAYYGKGAD